MRKYNKKSNAPPGSKPETSFGELYIAIHNIGVSI